MMKTMSLLMRQLSERVLEEVKAEQGLSRGCSIYSTRKSNPQMSRSSLASSSILTQAAWRRI